MERSVRPATIDDLVAVAMQIPAPLERPNPNLLGQLYSDADFEDSRTLLLDSEPVVCAGFSPLWERVVTVWCVASPASSRSPIWVARTLRYWLEKAIAVRGYRRVQGTVAYGFANGLRLADWLGFRYEGLMRSYGPDGRDYVMMARVC